MMNEIVILSGKGGTGKTSLIACFTMLAEGSLVIADCDVDAPDLHFLLKPQIQEKHEFLASKMASIDLDLCSRCGLCSEHCRFEAIADNFTVDGLACEGCGLCAHVCTECAISMEDVVSGHWFRSITRCGPMVHARLGFGEANSGKLVSKVRQESRYLAEHVGADLIMVDGPPGIGCPVIASLAGASLAVIVTEPSISGLHDLERVLDVCLHFDIRAAVCVNRYDLDVDFSHRIQSLTRQRNLVFLGRVPYDPGVTRAMVHGQTVVEYGRGPAAEGIRQLWSGIQSLISGLH